MTIGSKQAFYSGSEIATNLFFAEAKAYCINCGGKLIEPADQTENNAIIDYIDTQGGSRPAAIWIGVQLIGGR